MNLKTSLTLYTNNEGKLIPALEVAATTKGSGALLSQMCAAVLNASPPGIETDADDLQDGARVYFDARNLLATCPIVGVDGTRRTRPVADGAGDGSSPGKDGDSDGAGDGSNGESEH